MKNYNRNAQSMKFRVWQRGTYYRTLHSTKEELSVSNSVGSHSLAAKYTKVPDTLITLGVNYKLPTFADSAPTALAGKRVLMISADGPELPEIDVPMEYLKARGADFKLAGQNWI